MEPTSILGRIDRCPECDSEKMVFYKSRGRKKKNESRRIKWCCSDCGCVGFQSGCIVVVTSDGKKPEVSDLLSAESSM
jgi:hypothetical protein